MLVDEKTLKDLDFKIIVNEICNFITFKPAIPLAENIQPIEDIIKRQEFASAVAEMMLLTGNAGSEGNDPLMVNLASLEDTTLLLERLEKKGVLYGNEILKIEEYVSIFEKIKKILRNSKYPLPQLRKMLRNYCGEDETHRLLGETLAEIIPLLDEEGNIKDGATPELQKHRKKYRDIRNRIIEKIEKTMEEFSEHMQDNFYTIREGRYVLPVKAQAQGMVPGIIHGWSQSGATVYIEPATIIEDCNQLKIIEGEIQTEEEKILSWMSELLGGYVETFRGISAFFAKWDLICAITRFAKKIGANPVKFSAEPVLKLYSAKHPILLITGTNAVANDIEIQQGHGWIISGPNAGGKTVLIKTAGLITLMAMSGIPVPAGAESIVGDFDCIRSIIGDDQSVMGNLSTFSAQIKNITKIISDISSRSLILFDELATGTEPNEGSALSASLLEYIVEEKGGAVMVATHFENLKNLSLKHPKFSSIAMGFDFETLTPTFRITRGITGISGGLAIARKFGLPEKVIENAKKKMGEDYVNYESKLEEVEKMKWKLTRELEYIEKEKKELEKNRKEVDAMRKKMESKKKKEFTAEEAYLISELKLLHSELKEAHTLLRKRPLSKSAISSTERTREKIQKILAPGGTLHKTIEQKNFIEQIDSSQIKPKMKVHIQSLGIDGVLQSIDGKKGVILSCNKKIVVPVGDLKTILEENKMREQEEKKYSGNLESDKENNGEAELSVDEYQNPYNTLDVRGKDLDSALIEIDSFIETMMEMGLKKGYIIHGHGKGILKTGIRKHLRHVKEIEKYGPAEPGEGGDGCTVIKMKESK